MITHGTPSGYDAVELRETAWQAHRKQNTIPGYDRPCREDFMFGWAAALEAAETPTTVEWGVRIDGERPSETQVFDNEWAARDCAQNDKAWCSDAPRIVETRTVQRGPWELTP